MKKVKVCLGRLQEHLSKLSDDVKQRTSTILGANALSDFTVTTWPSREFMVKALRKQEANHVVGTPKHRAVVPLGLNEF